MEKPTTTTTDPILDLIALARRCVEKASTSQSEKHAVAIAALEAVEAFAAAGAGERQRAKQEMAERLASCARDSRRWAQMLGEIEGELGLTTNGESSEHAVAAVRSLKRELEALREKVSLLEGGGEIDRVRERVVLLEGLVRGIGVRLDRERGDGGIDGARCEG